MIYLFFYFFSSNYLMINNFIIVIPSYNRSELIKKKTLNFIINNKLNDNTIYIFTPQIEEYNHSLIHYKNIYIIKCIYTCNI